MFCFKVYKMNDIINKLLLVGDKNYATNAFKLTWFYL